MSRQAERPAAGASARAAREARLSPAKVPVDSRRLLLWGLLLASALVAAGVVAIQEALAQGGWITGTPWLTRILDSLDGLTSGGWMLPVGVLVAALGAWMIWQAMAPRPRAGIELSERAGVYLTPRAVARLAEHAASDVGGVTSAAAAARAGKVTVSVAATDPAHVTQPVRAAVTERLAALPTPPLVTVRSSRSRS